MTLKQLAITGIKWSFIAQFGRDIIQLATTIVMTRFLAPADFGYMAEVLLVTGFVTIFSDLGSSAAIIKRGSNSNRLISTIFILNVLTGLFITLLLYALSSYIALFFRSPALCSLLQLMSITFFVSSLATVHRTLLEKKLEFYKIARLDIAANLIGAATGILCALNHFGASSLIYQSIITVSATTLFLWFLGPHRFTFTFSWEEIRSITGFGLNLTGFSFVNYFSRNADNILIGRFLGAESLGYYSLAYRIMFYPLQSVAGGLGRAMFPVYARIQEDDKILREVYLKVAGGIALLTFPLMCAVLVLAEPLVATFFGWQWKPVALLLMILAPVGMLQSIETTVGHLYLVKGRTDLLLYWGGGSGLLLIAGFILGLQWGVVGVAAVFALLSLILAYPGFAIPFRLVSLPLSDLYRSLKRQLGNSIMMTALLFLVKAMLSPGLSPRYVLLILVPMGGLAYLSLCWFSDRPRVKFFYDSLRDKA